MTEAQLPRAAVRLLGAAAEPRPLRFRFNRAQVPVRLRRSNVFFGDGQPREHTVTDDSELMGPASLTVYAQMRHGHVRVRLVGRLIGQTRHLFGTIVEEAIYNRSSTISVDLRELDRVDLEGISTLLIAHLGASDLGKEILLVPGGPDVQGVIDRIHGPFVYTAPEFVTRSTHRSPEAT